MLPRAFPGSLFGQQLRLWRLKRAWTLDNMAEALGCSRQRAQQYETATIGPGGACCRESTARKIAGLLKWTPEQTEEMVAATREEP